MPPILDAMSLLPTGIAFDIVVDMFVEGCHNDIALFTVGRNLDGGAEILKPQEGSHVIG
jgi:hypothetical protein